MFVQFLFPPKDGVRLNAIYNLQVLPRIGESVNRDGASYEVTVVEHHLNPKLVELDGKAVPCVATLRLR